MTVKEFITRMECIVVPTLPGQSQEDALLNMELKIRIPNSSGQVSTITSPAGLSLEKVTHREKEVIVVTTNLVYN